MKHRCFTAETIGLRKEIVSSAWKAGCTELMLTPAASTIVTARSRFARRCRLCGECRFSPETAEEVSLLPAISAVSYEFTGHPFRTNDTFTPSQDEGSRELLALATGLEPLEPHGRGW